MQELLDEDREGFEVRLSHIGFVEAPSEANPASRYYGSTFTIGRTAGT